MKKTIISLIVGVAMVQAASAISYSFTRINPNNGGIYNPEAQLTVDITDAGIVGGFGYVDFKFENSGSIASAICDIYFDDGSLFGISSISDSGAGVAFSQGANPRNLPGGNNVVIPFVTSAGFSADSDSPVLGNGVDNSGTEWVTIKFKLLAGKTFQDTLDALAYEPLSQTDPIASLRIGLHVQGIGPNGESDAFVTGGGYGDQELPDGGTTVALLGLALVGLGGLRSRFARK
jgi:hypothetical protein